MTFTMHGYVMDGWMQAVIGDARRTDWIGKNADGWRVKK
jgi:hypothetical protein